MAEFYVEKIEQSNGEHIVHFSGCTLLPNIAEKIYLGFIASFDSAKNEAKKTYLKINACPECASKYRVAA